MAKFIGGPYDGRDLEFDPRILKRVNLPDPEHYDEAMVVRDDTSKHDWPHVYEADLAAEPAVYRYRD